MRIDRRTTLGILAAGAVPAAAGGAVLARAPAPARLSVGDRLPRFDLLRPGARTYLVSSMKGGRHIAQSVWRREVKFEAGDDGRPRLRISQHWDGVGDPAGFIDRESLFETETFRPSLHTRISTAKDGKRYVEGFRFGPRAVTALPGLADNMHPDFSVASDEAMYNFETDMEMLQTLPWARGYAVSIPFFHPAPGSVPARYLWSVIAEEALAGPDGRAIDCWVVGCDYNAGGEPTRFWLAKKTQQLVKMEGKGTDGAIRRKTLLF